MRVDFFHEEFRKKRAGLPDLLRYSSVIRPGVVLGKGGELISTYRYRGPDMQCASDAELNFLRSRAAEMVKKLGAGWMIHSTTLRRQSINYETSGSFPDPVTAAIEAERREQYQREGTHYENDYFLTFTYVPPTLATSRVKAFAYERDESNQFSARQLVDRNLAHFEDQLGTYVGILETGLATSRLTRLGARKELDPLTYRDVWYDDQLAFIHTCITGIDMPIRLPRCVVPVGVDYLLGSYDFFPGVSLRLNKKHIRVVAIEGLPEQGTHVGVLESLNKLGVEFRWTSRWIARDPEKAKADTKKKRAKWRQNIRGFIADATGRIGGPINMDAANMARETEAVLSDWESGAVVYGFWASTVVLMHDDARFVDASVKYLMKSIGGLGFPVRDEEENCIEAYLGSLPGHGYENVREPEIHSLNLADCLPLTSTWQGPASNPCSFIKKLYSDGIAPPLFQGAASGGTPFRFVLHNGDLGHAFFVGPPGAGKSTLLGLCAASHFRYPNARVVAFEKGESMLALGLGAGGQHYNFMSDDTVSDDVLLAPFEQLERLSDREWAKDYLETIVNLHEKGVSVDERSEIGRAIDLLSTRPAASRSFTDLIQLLQSRRLRGILEGYESKFAGGMLNGKKDSLTMSRFTVFEMDTLMEAGSKHVIPVLLYLFRVIDRMLDGSPLMIILDEAWRLLEDELFQQKIKDWLKTLRKSNAHVVFATQELQDFDNMPIGQTIFSSCQTKVLLPNKEAGSDKNRNLYQQIGLTDREIQMLTQATPKRDYFYKSTEGRRLFQLELGEVALAFIGATGKDDRIAVKQLYREHGANWVPHWLRRQGVDPSVLGKKAIPAAVAEV